MRAGAVLLCLVVLFPPAAGGADDKKANDFLNSGRKRYSKRDYAGAVDDFTSVLKLEPKNAEALDLRGSAYFMLGKFKESVADFDAYLKFMPDKADGHWRRGISLYYAGRYEEGKKQFKGYENLDKNDVENAVWYFLCAAKKDGLKKAREGMLEIGKDRRVPMMQVYDLFAGKLKPADVLKAANADRLTDEQRKQRLFYAHLYLGLYYDATGDPKKAAEHLALAAGKYRINHYMGEVTRVHHELLTKK
jgi:lipoprotein NlpI